MTAHKKPPSKHFLMKKNMQGSEIAALLRHVGTVLLGLVART
jgi:hypothetical protein